MEDNLKEFLVTKIEGRLTDEDLNKHESELSEMAASIPTMNGGGSNGHVDMITDDAFYQAFSMGGASSIILTTPKPTQ